MTQHPITPPPSELVLQWIGEFFGCTAGGELSDSERFLTTRAAQWGADQELEACVKWLNSYIPGNEGDRLLRTARRPKPPSLKEQALDLLDKGEDPSWDINDFSIIRRALEQLDD